MKGEIGLEGDRKCLIRDVNSCAQNRGCSRGRTICGSMLVPDSMLGNASLC